MNSERTIRVAVVGLVALAVAGAVFSSRLGKAAGTPPSEPAAKEKECPGNQPNDCRTLIAQLLHVDAAHLPAIDVAPPNLQYRGGHVVLLNGGTAPYAVFNYGTATSAVRYAVALRVPTAPPKNTYAVDRTPNGRKFQQLAPKAFFLWYVFYDEYLVYSIQAIGPPQDVHSRHTSAVAEELVDAVHPTTRQVAP
jgi:hypothetical protein